MTQKEIEDRREEIYIEQRKLNEELNQLRFEEGKNALEDKYPIESIIEYRGKKYFVRTYDGYWIKASLLRKDGTPSQKIQNIYGV
jgi:hypothetical protein